MGTAKVTESGAFYDVEDADGDIHTHLSLAEVAELLDVEEEEIKTSIAEGQGGVGYIDTDEDLGDEEDLEEDEDNKHD